MDKTNLTPFWLLICSVLAALLPGAQGVSRETRSFDADWRFAKGEQAGAERPDHDDQAWQAIRLPHDWSIQGPFEKSNPASGEGAFLPTGVAWYRKDFPTPTGLGKRRVFVEFDGVMANSDVWINGRLLGHRPNGYVSFRYDLTDHLNREEAGENLLAVRADTSAQIASRWYTGSGIYRHVRLVVVAPLHIDYHGVQVTTPKAEHDSARVEFRATLRNQSQSAQAFTLRSILLDPEGQQVAAVETTGDSSEENTEEVVAGFSIDRPRRWDLATPALYTLRNEVYLDGELTDETSTSFGVRKTEFRADTGFWLNDRAIKIKGVCLHHCGGAVGAAVPLGVWEYRLARLKELGVNAVRTAHNPVAPEFLDLCDRMGLLVMDEFFDCWQVGKRRKDYHLYFDQWAHRDLRDTILRDRNHPSVILYSVGNEIHDTHREEQAKGILRGLVDVCRETDPTRPVTQALFRPNVSHDYDNGLADMLDVIGTNYRDKELLQAHRDDPRRKIIGTEQGHDRNTWLDCRDNQQHAGQFLWAGIDYLGESRRWPVTTFNSGLLDRTGHPHPRAFERQSWWNDRPMVRVFRRVAATEETPTDPGYEAVEWKRRQVLFDDWTPRHLDLHTETVEVYSNCDEVELFLNGRSLGARTLPDDARPRTWKIDFEPGVLLAVAHNSGKEVARHEVRTTGVASRIQLSTNRDRLGPGWDEVAIIEAQVVDKAGTLLPRDSREIVFHVSGPGEVIAVDNGSIVCHEPFQATRRTTYQGRCVAVIRATGGVGELLVTAEAPHLQAGALRLKLSR